MKNNDHATAKLITAITLTTISCSTAGYYLGIFCTKAAEKIVDAVMKK